MSAKVKQITHYLDKRNWNYALQHKESIIYLAVRAKNIAAIDTVIALEDNGTHLRIVTSLFKLGDSPYKCLCFQTLLNISLECRLVRWAYDPIDGEICASVELALENANLTENQFYYYLDSLLYVVDAVAIPRLQSVLERGVDPGVEELGMQLLENLESNLPDGAIDALHNALIARKQRRDA